jgi:hypothetical protein
MGPSVSLAFIASSASVVSSARRLIGLVGFIGLLTHQPFLDSLATALIAAKTKYHGGSSKQQHSELPRCD